MMGLRSEHAIPIPLVPRCRCAFCTNVGSLRLPGEDIARCDDHAVTPIVAIDEPAPEVCGTAPSASLVDWLLRLAEAGMVTGAVGVGFSALLVVALRLEGRLVPIELGWVCVGFVGSAIAGLVAFMLALLGERIVEALRP